jgi:CDP-glycerol glycerophosphotransferase
MASRSLVSKVKHTRLFYNAYFYIGSSFIRLLKLFIKPNDRLIVFSSFSGKSYDDSPRAIYEGMIKDHRFDDYELVWDFRDPQKYNIERGSKIKTDTLTYYTTLLKARLWITNVSMYRGLEFTGINSYVFNTWHGTAIKKLGIDVIGKKTFKGKTKQKRGDVLLAQGLYDVKTFSHAYEMPQQSVLAFGLPRNDELVYNNKPDIINELKAHLGIAPDKKVILYAPTYREYQRDNNKNSIFSLPINIGNWEERLSSDFVILFRAHPDVFKVLNIVENDFVKDVSTYPHVNELMLMSDLLISDYSSIFFDYSILGRPMLCFAYDYDRYNEERGLYFDIRKELASERLSDENILVDTIIKLDWEERSRISIDFRDKYVESFGDATQKSLDYLYNVLNQK